MRNAQQEKGVELVSQHVISICTFMIGTLLLGSRMARVHVPAVVVLAAVVVLVMSPMVNTQEYPFRNTSLPFDERVKVLVHIAAVVQ